MGSLLNFTWGSNGPKKFEDLQCLLGGTVQNLLWALENSHGWGPRPLAKKCLPGTYHEVSQSSYIILNTIVIVYNIISSKRVDEWSDWNSQTLYNSPSQSQASQVWRTSGCWARNFTWKSGLQGSFCVCAHHWEMVLHCNTIFYWLRAYTEWSLRLPAYHAVRQHCEGIPFTGVSI